jgi:hypothetical protein
MNSGTGAEESHATVKKAVKKVGNSRKKVERVSVVDQPMPKEWTDEEVEAAKATSGWCYACTCVICAQIEPP